MEKQEKKKSDNRGYSLCLRPTAGGSDRIVYLKRSFRDANGKPTSHIIKKLGLLSALGSQENIDRLAAEAYEEWKRDIGKASVLLSEDADCEFEEIQLGEFYILHFIHEMGITEKLDSLKGEKNGKYQFDFARIVEKLICSQLLNPGSKRHMFESDKTLSFPDDVKLHQIYRALDILCRHCDEINAYSYRRAKKIVEKESSIYFYDCTNFVYTQGSEGELLGMKKSKEGIFAPLVQMGLLIDENGFLVGMNIFKGNKSEQPSLKNRIARLSTVIPLEKIVVCTDAGLCSFENKMLLSRNGRAYITTQPVLGNTVPEFIKEWVRLDSNFIDSDGNEVKIDEIKKQLADAIEKEDCQAKSVLMAKTFYKSAWFELKVSKKKLVSKPEEKKNRYETTDVKPGDEIEEDEKVTYEIGYVMPSKGSSAKMEGGKFYTRLLVSFSLKYYIFQTEELRKKHEKALKLQDRKTKKDGIPKELRGFVSCDYVTRDGEVAEVRAVTVDEDVFREAESFAGFYVQATNLGDSMNEIYQVSRMRWQIEYCFRTMKTSLNCVPVYLTTSEHVIGHFTLVCLSLQVLRTMMYKLYKAEGHTEEVLGRAKGSSVTVDNVLEELRSLRGRKLHAQEGYDFYLGARKNDMNMLMAKAFGMSMTKQVISIEKVKKYVG